MDVTKQMLYNISIAESGGEHLFWQVPFEILVSYCSVKLQL